MSGALVAVTFLCTVFAETGEPPAVCPNRTIKAVAGDLVSLPCYLHPPDNVVNYAVDWKRVDLNKVVHSYRHKQDNHHDQMAQYRNRTTIDHEGLSSGVLTLQISSLQPSDSGQYKCFVSKLMASCVIDLTVVEKDQQNETQRADSSTTGPPEEEVTKPGGRDGGNRNAGRAGTISTVFGILCVLIVGLVLSGTIQKCMKRLRKEQKPQTAIYRSEMKKVNTQAADREGDLERSAENSLGNIV